jgi:excisionase family DNA binding protein
MVNCEAQDFTIGEAAEFLREPVSSIRFWTETGKLQSRRTAGGLRLFSRGELERFRANRADVLEARGRR